ncbi:hypothetical protein [Nioella sp. MMSF_3534]|uniref:hypothetical protein n=1 Tax=Nioella sp. MMSF_3534 TaxID=3046720 RepID=UPI00273F7C61|nr:hypothetical protein [Nioella sp. MMSF_3534]
MSIIRGLVAIAAGISLPHLTEAQTIPFHCEFLIACEGSDGCQRIRFSMEYSSQTQTAVPFDHMAYDHDEVVHAIEGEDQHGNGVMTFYSILPNGVGDFTTVLEGGDAVYSRHTYVGGEIHASQNNGRCGYEGWR